MTDTEIVDFLLADMNRHHLPATDTCGWARSAGRRDVGCTIVVAANVGKPITREMLVARIENLVSQQVKAKLTK